MKNIIVPIDYSDACLNAASYAAALAKYSGAKIILFHSFPLCVPSPGMPFLFPDIDHVIIEHKERLDAIGESLSGKYGIPYISVCRPTPVIEELNVLCKQHKADLVVMGIRGSSPDYKLFGSTTVSAIREGRFPVLVVPPSTTFSPVKKILFACEHACLSPKNELVALKKIAFLFKSQVQVLHIEKPQLVAAISDPFPNSKYPDVEMLLHDIPHEYRFLSEDKVIHGIERGVNEYQPDILAMVPHKLAFWNALFNMGNTDKIAYNSRVPLLTLPNINTK